MMTGEREVMWSALAWPATEHLVVSVDGDGMRADGAIVALDGRPTRLRYTIEASPDWTVRRLTVAPYGSAGLRLSRRDDGRWFDGSGAERADLAGCVDVDIALTPFTNTLPIRRLGLAVGESADVRVVYVQVDQGLTADAADQRYERPAPDVYRYSSGTFSADLVVDGDGLVTDYPDLWRRLV